MGSYDGAESCELVGAYLLYKIKENFGSIFDFGLYRDDGLGISRASPRQTELAKRDLCGIFTSYGLKITIEAKKKAVNFLDITLNLSHGKYMAYTKPGNTPSTSTGNRTIHLVLSKTFRNPSINDCLKFQSIKIHFTNQHLFIRKL